MTSVHANHAEENHHMKILTCKKVRRQFMHSRSMRLQARIQSKRPTKKAQKSSARALLPAREFRPNGRTVAAPALRPLAIQTSKAGGGREIES